MEQVIINRGTGAGGSNTTFYGKMFEEKTNVSKKLLELGYSKNTFKKKPKKESDYYLSKSYEDKKVIFVSQCGLKLYMKKEYNVELFRYPDEAFIIEYKCGKKEIKILEKKEQHVNGSVETKLWAGPSLKREYEIVLQYTGFIVSYGYCVNNYLKEKIISNKKKYIVLNDILKESNIIILYGDDEDYFENFNKWINNSL